MLDGTRSVAAVPDPQCIETGMSLYGARVESDPGAGIEPCALPQPCCPVCGGDRFVPRLLMPQSGRQVVVCTACGLGRLHPLPSPDEIATFYPPAYYGCEGAKFSGLIEWMVRAVASRHSRFLIRQLPSHARVLDVGCGRGAALGPLLTAGCEVYGFEFQEDAIAGIDSRIHTRIAPSLLDAGFAPASFDMVILWHVLEHVPDPRALLCEIERLLRPNGTLVVAVPNYSSLQARRAGPDWFHLDLPRHLFHFPAGALRRLLTDVGLAPRSEHHFSLRQNPFGWIQSALNRCRWLPRNGLYILLHHRSSRDARSIGWPVRAQLYVAFFMLIAPSLLLSVLAAVMRQGATVHFVASKPAIVAN